MWPGAWNLLGIGLLFQFSKGFQDCGDIRLSASIIHLGAAVTASCTINPNCSNGDGTAKKFVWKLNWELLPEGWQHQREDGTLQSNITLPHLNHTHAILSCGLLLTSIPQIMGQAELQAGYPPQPPTNVSCIMNVTNNVLTCQWKSGPSTHLPTNFTLKSYMSNNCQSKKEPIQDCVSKDGESQCSIPRNQFSILQKINIWVKAENALGEAESPHLCINPMDVALQRLGTIQKMTRVRVLDNSALGNTAYQRPPPCIHVYNKTGVGKVGDWILLAIKRQKKKALIVGQRMPGPRMTPRFDSNNVVLIEDNGNPVSTRIKVLIPTSLRREAKLEPPILQAAKTRLDPDSSFPQSVCLQLKWEKPRMSKHLEQMCELRYQHPGEMEWVLVSPFLNSDSPHEGEHDLCGLLSATHYVLQMRCVRWSLGGQLTGRWSDWSPRLELTTKERRPVVRLDVWWRRQVQKLDTTMMDIQLLWKPVPTEENSSRIQGYLVFPSPPRQDGESTPLCNTTELSCAFQLPERDQKVILTAYNAAGESPPTTVIFWKCQGASLSNIYTSAPDAHSLWVGWEQPLGQPLPRAYVIEWCPAPVHQEGDCDGNWKIESDGSSTGTLLDENIMPFQLYKITVSPLYHDTRGHPQHIYAYSQEKGIRIVKIKQKIWKKLALSHAPKLKLKHIGRTWAELEWEPGAPELGKSPITQYTIFWTNTQDERFSIILNGSFRSCTLHGLAPTSMYHVYLMASNPVGGINSTVLTVVTIALEEKDIKVFLILISLFSVMMFCVVTLVCLRNNRKMKNQFWPNVPDPAHSSLGQWVPTILPGETIHLSSLRDPVMPPVSKIIVLKEEEKKPRPQTTGTDEEAKNLPHLVQAYIVQGNPFLPEPHASSNGPIQYGKVMGNQGYQSQQRPSAGLYLRTDSTQPLLADLSPSPKLYENMWFQRSPTGSRIPSSQGFPEEDSDDSAFLPHCPQGPLLDFPLLQGLRIEGAEGLGSI